MVPTVVPPAMEKVLLERLAENAEAFRSLEGVAKVRVATGDESVASTQVLFAEKPNRLRTETLSLFGQPVLLMATDGNELTVMLPAEGRIFRGEASARNLRRITRVPLRLSDLVQILLYQAPMINYYEKTLTTGEEGEYLLILYDKEGRRQELLFNQELNLVKVAYYQDNSLLVRINYDKFSDEVDFFPESVFLKMPEYDIQISLVFSEVRTNVAIPEGRFILTPPSGVEIQPLP
jgi:outer membrane lipoprotein-sorting protein